VDGVITVELIEALFSWVSTADRAQLGRRILEILRKLSCEAAGSSLSVAAARDREIDDLVDLVIRARQFLTNTARIHTPLYHLLDRAIRSMAPDELRTAVVEVSRLGWPWRRPQRR
jgi:hypothetical protein